MRRNSLETPTADMVFFENRARGRGFHLVAGIDEAGRGPLAGPVVAAAVMLPLHASLPEVTDSKLLGARKRERLYQQILCQGDVGTGCVDASVIDRINILQASFRAMILAVQNLPRTPDFLLIDGPYRLPLPILQEGIPRGDRRTLSIAAASIVAKVTRDRMMNEFHRAYPVYGFDRHKGYGTHEHLEALRRYGPCPLHRRTFRGVIP